MALVDREDNFDRYFKKIESGDISSEKLMEQFYIGDKESIDLKTEIPDSVLIDLTFLESLQPILKQQGLKDVERLIDNVTFSFKKKMVSRNREGRKEAQGFFGAIREQISKSGALDRLFGVGNAKEKI